MDNKEIVRYKLDKLITIMLTKGVQPKELTDNIFNNAYSEITFFKNDDRITGLVKFIDSNESIIMKYTYNRQGVLLRVEEESRLNKLVLWDRETREEELVRDIVDLMQVYYPGEVTNFINTLPKEVGRKIRDSYSNIA